MGAAGGYTDQDNGQTGLASKGAGVRQEVHDRRVRLLFTGGPVTAQLELFTSSIPRPDNGHPGDFVCHACTFWKPTVKMLPGGAAWLGHYGNCGVHQVETVAMMDCDEYKAPCN